MLIGQLEFAELEFKVHITHVLKQMSKVLQKSLRTYGFMAFLVVNNILKIKIFKL